jgi:hypothetical protein
MAFRQTRCCTEWRLRPCQYNTAATAASGRYFYIAQQRRAGTAAATTTAAAAGAGAGADAPVVCVPQSRDEAIAAAVTALLGQVGGPTVKGRKSKKVPHNTVHSLWLLLLLLPRSQPPHPPPVCKTLCMYPLSMLMVMMVTHTPSSPQPAQPYHLGIWCCRQQQPGCTTRHTPGHRVASAR